MNIFLWCIAVFLMVLGAAQLWEFLILWLCRPKVPLLRYELVPLSSSAEDLELLLQYVELSSSASKVLLWDEGLSEEGRELCRRICQEHSGLFLVSKEEALSMIFPQKELECGENP